MRHTRYLPIQQIQSKARDGRRYHQPAELMRDVAHAEALARQIEHELTEAMEIRDRETQEQLKQIAITERSAAEEREAADTTIRMFAEMLSQTDELASIYAAEADRSRVAGLACEATYENLRARDRWR